jgi:uncharacterized protein (TIGR00251 family)
MGPPKDKRTPASATLSVRIQPRASKNEVVAMENGGIKIRLTAPPVDGAANEALVKFLSQRFSVPEDCCTAGRNRVLYNSTKYGVQSTKLVHALGSYSVLRTLYSVLFFKYKAEG